MTTTWRDKALGVSNVGVIVCTFYTSCGSPIETVYCLLYLQNGQRRSTTKSRPDSINATTIAVTSVTSRSAPFRDFPETPQIPHLNSPQFILLPPTPSIPSLSSSTIHLFQTQEHTSTHICQPASQPSTYQATQQCLIRKSS